MTGRFCGTLKEDDRGPLSIQSSLVHNKDISLFSSFFDTCMKYQNFSSSSFLLFFRNNYFEVVASPQCSFKFQPSFLMPWPLSFHFVVTPYLAKFSSWKKVFNRLSWIFIGQKGLAGTWQQRDSIWVNKRKGGPNIMMTFRTLLEMNYPILQTLVSAPSPHCKLQMQIYCTGAFAKFFSIDETKKTLYNLSTHQHIALQYSQ